MIGLNFAELVAVIASIVAAPFALSRLWEWATAGDELDRLNRNAEPLLALGRATERGANNG